MSKTLSASLEDYLEAIFHISAQKQAARPKDISKRLKVNNSSVTGALKLLAGKGLVNYAPYEIVTLTGKGKTLAEDIVRRHETLRDFFEKVLAVSHEDAEEAACKMEHVVSREVLENLIQFTEFVETCPRGGSKWVSGFRYHCDAGGEHADCEQCITLCLEDFKQANAGDKTGEAVSLHELNPGQKGKVIKLRAKGEARKRIAEMGLTRGALVEVERVAPLGDPLEVKVKGYHLSLRKEEADTIDVERI
ncbi:MAG: metal-dependent transcriptional regulator [Planctomycetes bacterium]|nr:metal-dependent transcriptional regulator [Planctomycetota bacterium]